MSKKNMTHLFEGNNHEKTNLKKKLFGKRSKDSESFWTSIFVLFLLQYSEEGLCFPLRKYYHKKQDWCYKEFDEIVIPKGLSWNEILVEGRLSEINGKKIPNKFNDLTPDILLIDETNKKIYMIEVKTLSAITKNELYQEFSKFIEMESGYKTELIYLISAGFTNGINKISKDYKILLWEDVAKVMHDKNHELLKGVDFSKFYGDEKLLCSNQAYMEEA